MMAGRRICKTHNASVGGGFAKGWGSRSAPLSPQSGLGIGNGRGVAIGGVALRNYC
jgi:hypothetical protein